MHCFAGENQIYTGTVIFGIESLKYLKGQENLLLKNLQLKTRVENVQFLSWRVFFVGKYGIQSTNEMAFKRTVTLREFSISPPSDLVRPRYCRSADARMRTQNALLLDKAPDKAQ